MQGTGCSADRQQAWTQTTDGDCVGGHYTLPSLDVNQDNTLCFDDQRETATIRCCADAATVAPSTAPPSQAPTSSGPTVGPTTSGPRHCRAVNTTSNNGSNGSTFNITCNRDTIECASVRHAELDPIIVSPIGVGHAELDPIIVCPIRATVWCERRQCALRRTRVGHQASYPAGVRCIEHRRAVLQRRHSLPRRCNASVRQRRCSSVHIARGCVRRCAGHRLQHGHEDYLGVRLHGRYHHLQLGEHIVMPSRLSRITGDSQICTNDRDASYNIR